jgi:predicted phage tail protein
VQVHKAQKADHASSVKETECEKTDSQWPALARQVDKSEKKVGGVPSKNLTQDGQHKPKNIEKEVIDVETEDNKSTQPALLEQMTQMMNKYMKTIENKLEEQTTAFNLKLEAFDEKIRKLSTERQQQLEHAGQVISNGVSQAPDAITQRAFCVLECVRQAALGDLQALVKFALNSSPNPLLGPTCLSQENTRKLQEALDSIIPVLPTND